MKLAPLFVLLFIFTGCQPESSTVSDEQDQSSVPNEAQASYDLFTTYLAASMPEWRLITEKEWLAADYVES